VPGHAAEESARVIPVGDITSPAPPSETPRLPPDQPAVLILRDVLDWSGAETAELLDTGRPSRPSFDPEM